MDTLPKANSSPLKGGRNPKGWFPRFPHYFSGVKKLQLVLGDVYVFWVCVCVGILFRKKESTRNSDKNKQLFESLKIYSAEETEARQEVMYENYISSLCFLGQTKNNKNRGKTTESVSESWFGGVKKQKNIFCL